jgi:hypothetical protein
MLGRQYGCTCKCVKVMFYVFKFLFLIEELKCYYIYVTVFDIPCLAVDVCERSLSLNVPSVYILINSLKSFHNYGSLLGGSWLDIDAIGD